MDLWSYLHYNKNSFYNPFYLDPHEENTTTLIHLLPPLSQILRNVTLWSDYWCRWSATPTLINIPSELVSSMVTENGM